TKTKLVRQRNFVSSLRLPWPEFTMHIDSRANDCVGELVGFHCRTLEPGETPVNRKALIFEEKINRRGAKSAEKRPMWKSLCPAHSNVSILLMLRKFYLFQCLLCVLRVSAVNSLSFISGSCLRGFLKSRRH